MLDADLKIEPFRCAWQLTDVITTPACVKVTHVPTGLSATSELKTSQRYNREAAIEKLGALVVEKEQGRVAPQPDPNAFKVPADPALMIDFLNSLIALDRYALQDLMSRRVPCNAALADHPTVQVAVGDSTRPLIPLGEFRVGLLGIINGMCGCQSNGWGYIEAVYNDEGFLTHFQQHKPNADR